MILKKENDNEQNFNDFTSKLPYLGKEGKILLEEIIDTKEPFSIFIEANIIDTFYTKLTHSIYANYNRLTKGNSHIVPLQIWGRKSTIIQDRNRIEIYPEDHTSIKFSEIISKSYDEYEKYYDLEYQMGYFLRLNIVTENKSEKRIVHRIYYGIDGIKTLSLVLDTNEIPSLKEIPESNLTTLFDISNELKSKGINLNIEESTFKNFEEAIEYTKEYDKKILSSKVKKLNKFKK